MQIIAYITIGNTTLSKFQGSISITKIHTNIYVYSKINFYFLSKLVVEIRY